MTISLKYSALFIERALPDTNWYIDHANLSRLKSGFFVTTIDLVSKKATGISPAHCGPKTGLLVDLSDEDVVRQHILLGASGQHLMPADAVKKMVTSKFFLPSDYSETSTVMDNFLILLKIFFSKNGYIYIEPKRFWKLITGRYNIALNSIAKSKERNKNLQVTNNQTSNQRKNPDHKSIFSDLQVPGV